MYWLEQPWFRCPYRLRRLGPRIALRAQQSHGVIDLAGRVETVLQIADVARRHLSSRGRHAWPLYGGNRLRLRRPAGLLGLSIAERIPEQGLHAVIAEADILAVFPSPGKVGLGEAGLEKHGLGLVVEGRSLLGILEFRCLFQECPVVPVDVVLPLL